MAGVEHICRNRPDGRPDRRVRQCIAPVERIAADVRHAVGDVDRKETGIVAKRPLAEVLKHPVVGQLDRAQAGAAAERLGFKCAHAGDRHVLDGLAVEAPHTRVPVAEDGERHPVRLAAEHSAVDCPVVAVPDHLADRLAVSERPVAYARHACRNLDPQKAAAVAEHICSNRPDGRPDRRVRQRIAPVERILADVCHAVGDVDRKETGVVAKRPLAEVLEPPVVGQLDRAQAGASAERGAGNFAHAGDRHILHGLAVEARNPCVPIAVYDQRRQARLLAEHSAVDGFHAWANCQARNCPTVVECAVLDVCDAVGDDDAREVSAAVERIRLDHLHARSRTEARDLGKRAVLECIAADLLQQVVLEHDVLEIWIVFETVASEALDSADPDVARVLEITVI